MKLMNLFGMQPVMLLKTGKFVLSVKKTQIVASF